MDPQPHYLLIHLEKIESVHQLDAWRSMQRNRLRATREHMHAIIQQTPNCYQLLAYQDHQSNVSPASHRRDGLH